MALTIAPFYMNNGGGAAFTLPIQARRESVSPYDSTLLTGREISIKTGQFMYTLYHNVLVGSGPHARHLKPLNEVLKKMTQEWNEAMQQALVKPSGYFYRWLSNESWEEWCESKTSLGRVVSVFVEYIKSEPSVRNRLINRLDFDTLQKANVQAKNLLEKLIDQRASPDVDNGSLVDGSVSFCSSAYAGLFSALSHINRAFSFPTAEAASVKLTEAQKIFARSRIDAHKVIDNVGALQDVNSILEMADRVIQDKVGQNDQPKIVKAIKSVFDFFTEVTQTLGIVLNPSDFTELFQQDLEEEALKKIEDIAKIKSRHDRDWARLQLSKELKEAKKFVEEAPLLLTGVKADEDAKKTALAECEKMLEEENTAYDKLVAHSSDLVKLLGYQKHHVDRRDNALADKEKFDAVKGPLTDEMLNQLEPDSRDMYNNIKAVIADADKNLKDLAETMKLMLQHSPAFLKAIQEKEQFINDLSQACKKIQTKIDEIVEIRVKFLEVLNQQKQKIEDYEARLNKEEL